MSRPARRPLETPPGYPPTCLCRAATRSTRRRRATSSSDNNRGGSADGGKTGDVKGGSIDVSSKTVGGDAYSGKATGGDGGKGGGATASVSANSGAGAGCCQQRQRCFPRRAWTRQCGWREQGPWKRRRFLKPRFGRNACGEPGLHRVPRMCMSKQAPVRTMQMRKSLLAVTIAVAFSAHAQGVFAQAAVGTGGAGGAGGTAQGGTAAGGAATNSNSLTTDRRHGRPGHQRHGRIRGRRQRECNRRADGFDQQHGKQPGCGGHGQLHHAGFARRTQGIGGRRRSGNRPFRQRQQRPL